MSPKHKASRIHIAKRFVVKPYLSSMRKWIVSNLLVAALLLVPLTAWAQDVGGGAASSGTGASIGSGGGAPSGSFGTSNAPPASFGQGAAPGGVSGGLLTPGGLSGGPAASGVNGMFPAGNPAVSSPGPISAFGSTPFSSGQIQTLLSSPEAQAILSNPAALSTLTQKFGLSPSDMQNIRGQAAGGTLSQDQLNQLASRFGGIQASPAEVASIANALGLNTQQITQLQNTMAAKNQQNSLVPPTQQGAPAPAQTSVIEDKFRLIDLPGQMPASPDLSQLSQFGYSLFAQGVTTFAPVTNVPVGDDYIVGPGDELDILEWGRINQTIALSVNRDGSVQVPQLGVVQVGGLTFAQAKKLLESRLSQVEGMKANVTMGQLRTVQVFVVGGVNLPGGYTVSSLSTISNVLQQAGGVSKTGSLRHVELKRHGQRVDELDLYDLLLQGNSTHDVRVENGDVVFVPVIGNVVAVAGDVKRPAIYEINSTPRIRDVLSMAGGVTAFGYSEHIQVERVENHQRTVVLDVNLEKLDRQFTVRDGDLIKVYAVLPEHTNSIRLAGSVHRPGEYQWREGMRVSDLVRLGQGVLPHTYFPYAMIKRLTGAQKYVHYVPLNLGAALGTGEDGPADLLLQGQDELDVFSQDDLRDMPRVSVVGEVRNPGDYPLTEQMRLSDLIYQAGGLKDDANRDHAELARTEVGEHSRTSHAYMSVDLAAVLSGAPNRDILLKNNDQIFIKQATDWHLPESVTIDGRVARPGPYVIRRGERLSSVLLRCGGLLPDAFPQGIVFRRQSVQKLEQQRIDEARLRLTQQMAQYTMTLPLMNAQSNQQNGVNGAASGLASMQQLLATASTEQADGRVVVRMSTVEGLANSPDNVVLDDQDSITIPKRPSSVNVLGQVNNPTAIVAEPGLTVKDYLYRAGGPTKNGDMTQVMVINADGSVLTQQGIENGPRESLFPLMALTSGGLMNRSLSAGDTIYVPDNLADIPSYLRLAETKDITAIIAQSASALAVVGLLATKL